MDLDFDFTDDKIKEFLENKLNEIQASNNKLETNLEERLNFLKNLNSESTLATDDNNVTISLDWKKIWDNKYVICYEVSNDGVHPIEKIHLMLRWDLPDSLDYEVKIFETVEPDIQMSLVPTFLTDHDPENCQRISESLNQSSKIVNTGFIVVAFPLPLFVEKSVSNIEGVMFYEQDFNSPEKMVKLPNLEMDVSDVLQSKNSKSSSSFSDVLPYLSMQNFKLTMVISSEWSSSIDSTFEIYCSLTKLPLISKCKKYFMLKKVSQQIDNALVVVHAPSSKSSNAYPILLYTKNNQTLLYLIHHLHKSIPGVLLLPNVYYKRYEIKENVEEDYTKSQLIESLENELQFVIDFFDKAKNNPESASEEEVAKFRISLAKLEEKSDKLYLKLSNI